MRYIKDAPVVSPISYPSRVAPLPEDRVRAEEERGGRNEELQRESRRIQEDRWRGVLRHGVKEEEEKLPFPKLIKVENTDQNNKKNVKAVYDLKEAIRLVKVGYFEHFFLFYASVFVCGIGVAFCCLSILTGSIWKRIRGLILHLNFKRTELSSRGSGTSCCLLIE